MGYKLHEPGIYEVAAKAVNNLCLGVHVLEGRELSAEQIDTLAKHIAVIAKAALQFRKEARRIEAGKATNAKDNGNG